MENIAKSHTKVDEISPLTLAFVGDGVYDLLVRDYLVNLANRPVGELNKIKVSFVNCTSQAKFAQFLLPHLTEKETAVYKRGRNAKVNSVPHNADIGQYHAATGLEALFGWLYLLGRTERINELFNIITGGTDNAS